MSSAYSKVGHLADALFLNHDPAKRYFAFMTAYTAYFDASGDKSQTILSMGGFVSTVQKWKDFERAWNALLINAGVPYFHRKQFTAFREPFDDPKWKDEKVRRRFLAAMIKIIGRHVKYSPTNMLTLADWETVNKEYRMQEERMTPFAVVGWMSIMSVKEWCQSKSIPFNRVEFVFEDGDGDKSDFEYWCKKYYGWVPIFKPGYSENQDVLPLTPLQACDFFAGEARSAEAKLDDPLTDLNNFRLRKCLVELVDRTDTRKQEHEKWTLKGLRSLCQEIGIPKR